MECLVAFEENGSRIVRVFKNYCGVFVSVSVCVEHMPYALCRETGRPSCALGGVEVNILGKRHSTMVKSIVQRILESELLGKSESVKVSLVIDVFSSQRFFVPVILSVNDVLEALSIDSKYTAEEEVTSKHLQHVIYKNCQVFHFGRLVVLDN